MRFAKLLLIVCVLPVFLLGCGSTTKTVNVHSEDPMVIGQQMSCIYHVGNLYCASPLLKVEDIDSGISCLMLSRTYIWKRKILI